MKKSQDVDDHIKETSRRKQETFSSSGSRPITTFLNKQYNVTDPTNCDLEVYLIDLNHNQSS